MASMFGGFGIDGTLIACARRLTNVTSQAEMPYLAFIANLYLGIEATSCQVEGNFSALGHLIDHLRCNMLARKVQRMMLIRLNRHLVDEVRKLDAAVAQARAKASKSAQKSFDLLLIQQ